MSGAQVDAVLTEICRNAFVSIAEQMNRTLIRTAHSPVIYEMRDCSVGLFDAEGQLWGQSSGLPIFLGNLEEAIRVVVAAYGQQQLAAGDVFILNDSYLLGTHLADVSIVAPIFHHGVLVAYSVSRAHWRDIGARDPGGIGTVEIYQEGLRLGPVRIVRAGEVDRDLLDVLKRNSRTPEMLVGDLHAQLAAATIGARGVAELLCRYDLATLRAAAAAIFAHSAAIDRAAVAALPDGRYEASGSLDNDGVGSDGIEVRVAVEIASDEMHIDLTGSSAMVEGFVNCGRAQTISACRVAFKTLINPDAPVTGGSFAPLRITVPEESLFDAREPAACQFYFTPLGLLIDLVARALAPALPERVAAAHFGDSMVVNFVRRRRSAAGPFLVMAEALAGGWGAGSTREGESALINNVNGGFRNLPVEVAESKFPIRIRSFSLRHGSGGAGRHRGGDGVVREYEVLEDGIALTLHLERSRTPAWGLFGGGDALGPDADLALPPQFEWQPLPRKMSLCAVARGSRIRVATGGGGGLGRPLEAPVAPDAETTDESESKPRPTAIAPTS